MSHHLPSWEMGPGYRSPTIAGTLGLLAVVTLLLLALLSGPQASGAKEPPPTTPACAQHWPPTCKEAPRGP
jgi:hypothetical protein